MKMFVGVVKITLFIYASDSLKEKRRVLRSIKERFRNKFNYPLIEVDNKELWQKSTLGSSAVSDNDKYLISLFQEIEEFFFKFPEVEVIEKEREIFSF